MGGQEGGSWVVDYVGMLVDKLIGKYSLGRAARVTYLQEGKKMKLVCDTERERNRQTETGALYH